MANGPDFFQTQMGRAFYERNFPQLVKTLKEISGHLEQIATNKTVCEQQAKIIDLQTEYISELELKIKQIKGE